MARTATGNSFRQDRLVFSDKDIDALDRVFGRVPKEALRWLGDKVTRAAARQLAKEAKRRAPVKTGDLKRHIVAKKNTRGTRWITYVVGVKRPETPLAHLVEFGTEPHIIRVKRFNRKRRRRPKVIRHPGAKAQPFLRPALTQGYAAVFRATRKEAIIQVRKLRRELMKRYDQQAKWVDKALGI